MKDFIDKNNLIYSSQYGFRKSHSAEHAVLDIVEDLLSNMDKQYFSSGIFIDLKKAFDTVNHEILLNKLNFYGFRGLIIDWFQSYFKKNRTQTIQIGEHLSTKLISPCGVPQQSVLGPLLFLLYTNNINLSSDKLKFYLFADDTNILYADKNLKAIEQTVNAELNNVHDWLITNRLTLNIKKSKFLISRSPQKKKKHFSPQISILD